MSNCFIPDKISNKVQAVILAGGKGTRLSSVTNNLIPKPMVLIDNIPLLEHQLMCLKKQGIKEILLIIGYLGNVITDYFKDGSDWGIHIYYYVEEKPLGTGGAISLISDYVEENFLLIFGDIFFEMDFPRLLASHIANKALITMTVHPNTHPFDSDLVITSDKCIEGVIYKNQQRNVYYKNLVNAGIYCINKQLLCTLTKNIPMDFEKDIVVSQICNRNVFAYKTSEYIKDIGTPERLNEVCNAIHFNVPKTKSLKNKQKCIFLDRDGTINRYVGFLNDINQFELMPTAAQAIRLINESGYLAIVITNQPVIARGELSLAELDAIHNKMETLLGEKGAYLDAIYYCPHHPDKGFEGEIPELKINCDCRKPKTGMIKKAIADYNIDLKKSWMIGDTEIDMKLAENAGIHGILVNDKLTILDTVNYILKRGENDF